MLFWKFSSDQLLTFINQLAATEAEQKYSTSCTSVPADSCFISVIVILCAVKVYRGPGLTSLWTSSVMLTKWPPLTRTEELEPAFTRQNIAEWAINVLKYHLHANTGTTHSSRPGQRELLISRIHYSGYSALRTGCCNQLENIWWGG